MKTLILAGATAIALLGLHSTHAQSNCADGIAAMEADLTKREAVMGKPENNPKAKQVISARRLLEEAKEARGQGKENRCQKKLEIAKSKLPK